PTYALANDWPTAKPIKIIVSYASCGFSDTRVRKLGQELAKVLNATVVVENRACAGGVIGTSVIARFEPDCYILGSGKLALFAANPTLMPKNVTYNVKTDLAPVILIEESPLFLNVNKQIPVNNVAELIALAKKEPGKITYGSSGVG